MEKSFKRLLSFAMALLMVLTLVPVNGLQVYATDTQGLEDLSVSSDAVIESEEDISVNFGDSDEVSYVAKIGKTNYESLQEALNAAVAQGGEVTVTLTGGVTENVTITEKVGMYLTIDGADKTMNGKVTVKALSDTNDNRRTTIQNVNFVNSGDTGVDFITSNETNHYPRLTVADCSFTGNGKDTDVAIRTKSAYGMVIEDCTGTSLHSFLQNTSGVTITVKDVTVTDSKGGLAMGTAQNVTISGCDLTTRTYGIRLDAVLDTAVTLNDNTVNAYIPVSVRKATAENYQLTIDGESSSYTATNADGKWCAICATEYEEGVVLNEPSGNVHVTLNDAGLNAAGVYGNYVEKPTGSLGTCYIQEDTERARIYGEILGMTNATQSVVVKLYSGETLLATTTLVKSEYLSNSTLGVNIVISGKTSSSWNTVWEKGQPAKDLCPDKAVLYIDGNEMNTAIVTLGTIDDLGTPYVWEELEIFKVPVAQTMDAEGNVIDSYFTFEEALAAACADANVTRLEILADSEQTTVTNTTAYYNINQALTIGAPTGKSYTVTVAPNSAAMKVRVQNGGSLTIAENVTINHLNVVANGFATTGENMTIEGTLYALSLKQWTNNGTITVTETGKVILGNGDGQFDLAYGNGTVTINGTGDKTVDQFKAGYSGTRGSGNTLNLNNTSFEAGAWFTVNGSNGIFNVNNSVLKVSGGDFNGDLTVTSTGNKINLTNGSELKVGALVLGEGNQLKLDATSKVTAKTVTGAGTLIIDATGMQAGDIFEGIAGNVSGFTGKIEVTGSNLVAEIVDGKIVLKAAPVASVNGVEYADLESALKAIEANSVVEILDDITITEDWDCRFTGAKITVPVTINGNEHTIKFTGNVNDKNWNTVFRFEADATVKNLTVDASEATDIQRGISAKYSITVDNCTFIGNGSTAKRAIIFGEGAGTAIGEVDVTITNSTFKDWGRGISDNENGQDAKTLTITGNTFTAASVNVSAAESIIFNGNVMNDSWAKLVTYKSEILEVTAQGNTLTANGTTSATKNYIYAKTANAQEGFIVERLPYKVSTKAELNKALAAAQEGDEIILTADIDYGSDQLKIERPIILNLGDKTLTTRNAYGGMSVKGNPTIKNGTIVHASNTAAIKVWNAAAFEDLVIDVQGKGDANKTIGGIVLQSGTTTRVGSIKNVTIKGDALTNGIETYNCGDASEDVIGSMENVTIDANGTGMLISAPCGTATNCSISGDINGIEIWIKGTYSAKLDLVNSAVEGGVFAHDEFSSNPAIVNNGTLSLTVDNETTGASEEDITLTIARAEEVEGILKDFMDNAEAKVNDTYYATLQAAIDAAGKDDTITVLTDIELTENVIIDADTNVVIEGEGKTISGTCDIFAVQGGTLTLGAGLNVVSNKNCAIFVNNQGGTVNTAANLTGKGIYDTIYVNGTATANVTITGGTIESKQTNAVYFPCQGKLTINGGTLTGETAVYFKSGSLEITGGTFNGVGAAVAYEHKGSGATATGDAVVIENVGGTSGYEAIESVSITNGTFNSTHAKAVASYTAGNKGVEAVTGFITGGTFDEAVAEGYCAEGYIPVDNGDGTYTVKAGKFVAQIGEKKYADLHEAMVACKAGETVLLISDVDLAGTEWEPVSFKGTFDGQNHTISNLTINKPGVSNTGFITSLNGTFKNVTFTNPTVTGGECTGVVAGRAGGDAALAKNITVNGTIKVEVTHSGYARAGVIVGGWAYGNYENITVDGGNKDDSYIKHTGGGDGRYVAGIVGHADGVDSYVDCTVKNITIDGDWLCGAIAGPGPSNGLASGCVVENVDIHADYSGGMFGWYYGNGTIEDSSIKNVAFTDGTTKNGAIGGYSRNTSANVVNVTIENVTNGDKALLEHVAEINGTYYFDLQAAVNAAVEGDTITILAGTVSEGTVKLPATMKNVTFKGEEGAILEDTTIIASDGNSICYEGLTFDGITFENSRITITGWRTGGATVKDLTVTNCTFKNLDDTTSSAPVHINMAATEAVENFTFTNNVIDGATGGQKSGVYAQTTGKTVFTGNTINNVSFRPYVIQITTDDGIDDEFIVTGNTFSGSAAGRAQGLGNNAEGTDTVKLVVSENIFKDSTTQQICYWNFNEETTTADLSKNYYDIDILNNPSKIYYNSAARDVEDLIEMGVFPYYADEAKTQLVEAPAIMVTYPVGNPVYPEGKVEYYQNLLEAVPYTTNCPRLEGATVTLLRDIEAPGIRMMENDMVLDLNGHTYTITAGTGSQGTNTSGFQIRPEVTTVATIKNGTIQVAEGAPVVWMFNNYATDFVVEDVTIDCANMAYSHGERCYVHVSRAGDNTQFAGNTKIINFNSEVAGDAINVGGTMTMEETVVPGGSFELDVGATLTAPADLDVTAPEGYEVVYENGVYSLVEVAYVAQIGDTKYETFEEALDAAKAAGMTEVEVTLLDDCKFSTKVKNFTKVTVKGTDRAQTLDLNLNAVVELGNVELVFEDLTVSRLDKEWLYHWFYAGKITYSDCKMIGLFNVSAQDTDFIGCDFYNDDSFGDGNYSLWVYNCFEGVEVNVTDCTFDVYERAIKMYGDGYTGNMVLNISGTNFTSRTVDKTVVEIAQAQNCSNGSFTLNVTESTYTGFGAYEHTGNDSENTLFNVEVASVGGDVKVLKDTVQLWPLNYVAQIGDAKYTTLQAAIDAAGKGDTIILLDDTIGAGAVINKSITIDFGTHTYTFNEGVGSDGTESNGLQILKGNTVTLKNGTLNVAEESKAKFYTVIQNYADLTVTNMTLDGTNLDKWSTTDGDSIVLSNNSGNVTIDGKTNIIANNEGDRAYAFDVYDYSTSGYTAPVVSVETTGKIAGQIKVTGAATLAISDGTYTVELAEQWCAEGYIPVDNGDGTYTVKAGKFVAWNVQTQKKYETVAAALTEATYGQTVQMLTDSIEATSILLILNGVTLDLNGKTLTALYAITTSVEAGVIDSANAQGILKVAKTNLTIQSNAQLPVWIEEDAGFRFATVTPGQFIVGATETAAAYAFYIDREYSDEIIAKELADGSEDDDGLTVTVKMYYTDENGQQNVLNFTPPAERLMATAHTWYDTSVSAKAISMTVYGIDRITNISFQTVYAYGNTQIVSERIPLPQNAD